MACKHGSFWIGLGVGSVLGAIAYRLSRTEKAKQLENEILCAVHRIGHRTKDLLEETEKKALCVGAKMADKVAENADRVAEKADQIKEKWDKIATDNSKK